MVLAVPWEINEGGLSPSGMTTAPAAKNRPSTVKGEKWLSTW